MSGMFPSVFCFLSVVIVHCAGDLLISDLEKNKHLLVSEDLTLKRIIDNKCDGPIFKTAKARKSNDGLVIYNLHLKEITLFNVTKEGKVSESGKIAMNGRGLIDDFDVQPSGDFVAITDRKKVYLYSQAESELTELFELSEHTVNVLIHPTKRIIYYSTCSKGSYIVNAYDVESKTKTPYLVPFCLNQISFNPEENVIWANSRNRIVTLNLNNKEVVFISSRKEQPFLFATSFDDIYLMAFDAKIIYRLIKNPKPQKQSDLSDFKIEPVISYMKAKTPVLFNIEESFIELFDEDFAKTGKTINLEIEKKPIKSIRSTMGDGSTTFYWIHDSNEGVLQFAKVDHNDNNVVARDKFHFQTKESREIIDFDIEGSTFYLAIEDKIFKGVTDVSKLHQDIRHSSTTLHGPIKAVEIQQKKKKLFVSHCEAFEHKLIKFPLKSQDGQPLFNIPLCPEKILSVESDYDEEATNFILSTTTGLYRFDSEDEYEQIYGAIFVRSFLASKDYVYFVSKIDG